MRWGRLVGLKQIRWTPLPEETKRFGIHFSKPRSLYAWGCEKCGLVTLNIKPKDDESQESRHGQAPPAHATGKD